MSVPQELFNYLAKADPPQWRVVQRDSTGQTIELLSQTWQGIPWEHTIVLSEPPAGRSSDLAILYITGADPNPLDKAEAELLARLSGLPVAHLFHIPVQPLLGGLFEDDLIAETFVRYLQTGDGSWPLLFPMTKAALAALDAISAANPDIRRFLLTGASKRGWTAWMAGASGDPRIAAIAPMVIDNLNVTVQMQKQVEAWQGFSDMISPYTSRGLQESLSTEDGRHLASIVDPYTYRDTIAIPKLIITGSNDRYWTVDAMSNYWDGLVGEKWASVVPNAGHDLGDKSQALTAIAALGRSLSGGPAMPSPSWRWTGRSVEADAGAGRTELWLAEANSLDFRDSSWKPAFDSHGDISFTISVPPSERAVAALLEFHYERELHLWLSAPIKVFA